jgi:hypothetical protein
MSLFESWHASFQELLTDPAVAAPLKAAVIDEDLKAWTTCLTSSVVETCRTQGWQAAAKGHLLRSNPKPGQEYLNIDVMAFAPQPGSVRWAFPAAVFELENARTDARVAYSLWKVLCVRASLRVIFAFRRNWESSRRTVDAVCEDVIGGMSIADRMRIEGDTLIIIGNRGDGDSFPWGYFKCWRLDVNLCRFNKIW